MANDRRNTDRNGERSVSELVRDLSDQSRELVRKEVELAKAELQHATPNVKLRGFKWVTPGAVLAVVVWLIASAAFAFYVANFGSYDKIYGTLGGVVVMLVWLWITNLALLFGHQLNAERERGHELAEGVPRAEREIQLEPRSEPKRQRTT